MVSAGGLDIETLAHSLERMTTPAEYRAAIEGLDTACRDETVGVEAQFDKVATKLLTSVSKLMTSKKEFHPYGLMIVKTIVCNCSKSVRISNHAVIMKLAETYLCYASTSNSCGVTAADGEEEVLVNEAAAVTLSVLHSTEGATTWTRLFQRYVDGCLLLLRQQLGVDAGVNAKKNSGSNNTNTDKFDASTLPPMAVTSSLEQSLAYGTRKAYVVSKCFSAYCRVLQCMLTAGCSTGPVVIPMPSFLELCHLALHTISSPRHVSIHMTKNRVQNEIGGVSVLDVSGIAVALKTSCLEVVDALLSTPNPYLFRIADVLCRFIHHCMISEAVAGGNSTSGGNHASASVATTAMAAREYQCLFTVACSAFLKALSCFPPSVINKRSMQGIVSFILAQFRYVMRNVLLSPVGSQGGFQGMGLHQDPKCEFVATTTALQRLVFQVVRVLLVRCGVLLPPTERTMLQVEINMGLSAINKGVVTISSVGGVSRSSYNSRNSTTITGSIDTKVSEGITTGNNNANTNAYHPHHHHSHDRKAVHRCVGYEFIRASTLFQCLLVQLATTELMVPPSVQQTGGTSVCTTNSNSIGLLRSVCTLCKSSTHSASRLHYSYGCMHTTGGIGEMDGSKMELLAQISCTEVYLDVLLHPSAVPLPSRPLVHQAQDFLSSYRSSIAKPSTLTPMETATGGGDDEGFNQEGAGGIDTSLSITMNTATNGVSCATNTTTTAAATTLDLTNAGKRKFEALSTAVSTPAVSHHTSSDMSFGYTGAGAGVNKTTTAQGGQQGHAIMKVNNNEEDDDDDDDMPDIDLS